MAHNPMIEIVLEKALNALSECDNVLATEIITLQYQTERIKDSEQIAKRLEDYQAIKRRVESVLKQGNALDI